MLLPRLCACFLFPISIVLLSTLNPLCCPAEEITLTEVAPHILVFATSSGNVVCSVGPDGALLIGTPSIASTPEIDQALASRTKSPFRYLVLSPEDLGHSQGDAGWGKRGAFVAMQEKALERLGGHAMGPPKPLPGRLAALGIDRPHIAFSEVLTFDMNGDSIHVVHQSPGYSDADSIAHFHVGNLVYLGEVFPGDSYPAIDPDQHGSLDGLLKTMVAWTSDAVRIVPARGRVTRGTALKAYYDMITNVRGRVQNMINSGASEPQILAEHPTAEFDERWGHGRVTATTFIHELYIALARH